MNYYRHDFDNVEDYLHHRDPYLLIDRIIEIGDDFVTAHVGVSEKAFFMKGHFPGAPILPGAMMQEMTTQTAGILIAARFNPMEEYNTHDPFFNEFALGVLVKVESARYRGFARPGDQLTIRTQLEDQIQSVFVFRGTVSCNGKAIMTNKLHLTNIPSQTLQGIT